MAKTPEELAAAAQTLRAALRSAPHKKVEFLATISKFAREHNLPVDDELLGHLNLGTNGELKEKGGPWWSKEVD